MAQLAGCCVPPVCKHVGMLALDEREDRGLACATKGGLRGSIDAAASSVASAAVSASARASGSGQLHS